MRVVLFFVCFAALCPKPTVMVMERGSVHLNTLFLVKPVLHAHTFACN